MRRGLFDLLALIWAVGVTTLFIVSYAVPHAAGKIG